MKRLLLITLILCLNIAAQAQMPDCPQQKGTPSNSRHEQLLSARIAFFTTEMNLTPQEAAAFWPVYNQYWEEKEIAHKRVQRNMRALRVILKEKKPNYEMSLKRIMDAYIPNYEMSLKRIMDAYITSLSVEGIINRKYFEEFQKVLPVEKVAAFYKAEEDFRIKLIYELRKGGENRVSK